MTDDTMYVGTVAVKIAKKLSMLERAKNDRYATPRKNIRQWLKRAALDVQFYDTNIAAIDTGCGIDARWAQELKVYRPSAYVEAVDINDDAGTLCSINGVYCTVEDYIGQDYKPSSKLMSYNLLIGNPPFKLANQWLKRSFEIVNKEVGRVSFLFPITLASTKARRELYKTYPISRMLIYTNRVSFEGYTGTYPAREYAQFEWWFYKGDCLKPSELASEYGIEPIDYLD